MKITVKNLGVLKQAEFTLGDLTIICGSNNSGKTYATYSLFGFLATWQDLVAIEIPLPSIEQLLSQGVIRIDLQKYIDNSAEIIKNACIIYTKNLSSIFAAPENQFRESEFHLSIEKSEIKLIGNLSVKINAPDGKVVFFSIDKSEDSHEVIVTSLASQMAREIPIKIIQQYIGAIIRDAVFMLTFSRIFIASAERTGIAIFRKELNFSPNFLAETLIEYSRSNQSEVDIKEKDIREIFRSRYQDYPLPVKKNVEFMRNLENISKKNSFIAEEHPDILNIFADIIGGEYMVSREDELYYLPKQGKKIKLSMDVSSSAVRSLLDIGFYLRHEARQGDLLMVDEPELNLHPENQRRVARLFARLVNIGIKVFITTHSDYIIKELNTLIMLNRDLPHLKEIAEDEGYLRAELLSADRVKVYMAEESLVKLDGRSKRVRCPTLVPAKIDDRRGIEAKTFDETIDKMNRIQDAIVWGGE